MLRTTTTPYKNIIGTAVSGIVDRPMGSCHPKYPDLIYPVNYGYIPDVFAGDGEEQDVYVIGIDHPVTTFTGTVIAIIHRIDDCEDKWIVSCDGKDHGDDEILNTIHFQEQYFRSILIR